MVTEAPEECTTEALFAAGLSTEERCLLALANCNAASAFNFYKLYFCTLEASDV